LDIFGFENFKTNSFEQLCINIANEQIQYYFNQHIFRLEQQEYLKEGISMELITFNDNKPVIDMFLGRPLGILVLLDEETHFPNATDASLVEKLHNNIRSQHYLKPKSNALQFTILHYAGKVTYDARHFLDKNRNHISPEIIQLLRQSTMSVIKALFETPLTKTGHLCANSRVNSNTDNARKEILIMNSQSDEQNGLVSQTKVQQTVLTYFRFSLTNLIHKLTNGVPHFVRCIKPNDHKLPMKFCHEKISSQLAYTGIMETIKIRQMGYSHRIGFAEFLNRYSFLAFKFSEPVPVSKESCRMLLTRLQISGYQLGKTKVFLKYYQFEELCQIYDKTIKKVIKVQTCVRCWLARRKVAKIKSVTIVQKYARGWLVRKKVTDAKRKKDNLSEVTKSQKSESNNSIIVPCHAKRRAINKNGYQQKVVSKKSPDQAAILIQKRMNIMKYYITVYLRLTFYLNRCTWILDTRKDQTWLWIKRSSQRGSKFEEM